MKEGASCKVVASLRRDYALEMQQRCKRHLRLVHTIHIASRWQNAESKVRSPEIGLEEQHCRDKSRPKAKLHGKTWRHSLPLVRLDAAL